MVADLHDASAPGHCRGPDRRYAAVAAQINERLTSLQKAGWSPCVRPVGNRPVAVRAIECDGTAMRWVAAHGQCAPRLPRMSLNDAVWLLRALILDQRCYFWRTATDQRAEFCLLPMRTLAPAEGLSAESAPC